MSTTTEHIRVERHEGDIVVLTLDSPGRSSNALNEAFQKSFYAVVDRLVAERDDFAGVVITSAKPTFVVGADLVEMHESMRNGRDLFEWLEEFKAALRRLETLGRPVVAAVNGTALGGGFELALGCHHVIVVDDPSIRVGLPEVTLGLLPAGGGVTRMVRRMGLVKALTGYLLEGRRVRPQQALADGAIDEVVPTVDDLLPAAVRWIRANPEATAPWDAKGYRMPGGTPSSPGLAAILPSFPANLIKQTNGANLPAPRAILATAVEGAQVAFDAATTIESRYMVGLQNDRVATNMTQAFFFDLRHCNGGGARPQQADGTDFPVRRPTKVAVIGAGMMGAGIAYVTAKAGVEVVLKDVDLAAAERGKAYAARIEDKAVEKGRRSREDADALLARITPTGDLDDLAGCDFVIEAVFESPELKDQVFRDLEPVVAPDALLGSNTSTLPITGLAQSVQRQDDFIGLHFFSPVEKMPLLEIIRGEKTSDAALARALDYAKVIGMTPIVVKDSRGFYTSRVFTGYIAEACEMLAEGIDPAIIEHAGRKAGYPAAPLQLIDELNLTTIQKILRETARAAKDDPTMVPPKAASEVIDAMVDELDRPGRFAGKGFYEYADGRRTGLWSGLRERFGSKPVPGVDQPAPVLDELVDRFLFVQVLETQRCVDEGVITSDPEANIGAIMGIGFPAWTGGPRQFLATYPGGLDAFRTRAGELEAAYGPRFAVPASLAG